MPWQERSLMDERVQFITDYQRQLLTMTALCDRYGISRKTGYKLIGRYEVDGAAALTPRRSRPGHSPQTMSARVGAHRDGRGGDAQAVPDVGRQEDCPGPERAASHVVVARGQYGQ